MIITMLHKNKAQIERPIFLVKIILTKKLSFNFGFNKPLSFEEAFKEKPQEVHTGLTQNE